MNTQVTRREALGLAGLTAVFSAAALSGCDSSSPAETPATHGTVATQQLSISPATANGDPMTLFAADTTATVLSTSENVCFSPASLYLDLGMVGVGATGQTQSEVLKAMRANTEEDLAAVLRDATDDLNSDILKEQAKLHTACSIWSDEDCPATPEFKELVEKVCDAQAMTVEFGTSEGNQTMTDWVSEQTEGLLTPEFDTEDPNNGDGTAMILLNAVYLKPEWENPFDSNNNVKEAFVLADGTKVDNTEFMAQCLRQRVKKGDGYVIASLPFKIDTYSLYEKLDEKSTENDYAEADKAAQKASCSMAFILPDEGKSLSDVLGSPDAIFSFLSAERDVDAEVSWKLPKMDFDCDFDLVGSLRSLGILAAFEPSQDFKEMVAPKYPDTVEYISSVRQGTHITLNEEGVEAAAYTSIEMKTTATGILEEEPEHIDFFCTRPFGFAIYAGDRVLFTGVFNTPEQ